MAKYAGNAEALAAPGASVQAVEMSVAAEIGCLLSIGRRAAGALVFQARVLEAVLPLTLAGLMAGALSWQHARVMVDETA
ncbi:MAG: endonuclease, partial [Pseudarthrobacter sp.]|nr:endonuclease [Pseudarthrobacter sp.]